MIDCVSVRNMRLSDRQTIERGTLGKELIRRAAYAVYHAVEWHGNIAVVTGSGNNGADGFALSDILRAAGYFVTVFQVSEQVHADCAYFANEAAKNGVRILPYHRKDEMLKEYDMIVDCMLGTDMLKGTKLIRL